MLFATLCVVMALASFFAGALPLSIALSQSHLRLISNIGVGILVGTSLIIIIPEGIEAVSASVQGAQSSSSHGARGLLTAVSTFAIHQLAGVQSKAPGDDDSNRESPRSPMEQPAYAPKHSDGHHGDIPTMDIGLSLLLGFALMFLIDRLPRHAVEIFRAAPQPRHVSLDSLGHNDALSETGDDGGDGFLGSLAAPSPRHTRSLATTVGLVIHAVTDGIAMGASSTADTALGFIVFMAIMIHKAPVSFGLTSLLLSHGLSKRAARGHLIVFSLAAPMGALATWLIAHLLGGTAAVGGQEETGQWWTGMLLLFSAGTFL